MVKGVSQLNFIPDLILGESRKLNPDCKFLQLPMDIISLIFSQVSREDYSNLAATSQAFRALLFQWLKENKHIELLRVKTTIAAFSPEVDRSLKLIEESLLASQNIMSLKTSIKLAQDAVRALSFHIPVEHRSKLLAEISQFFDSQNYMNHFSAYYSSYDRVNPNTAELKRHNTIVQLIVFVHNFEAANWLVEQIDDESEKNRLITTLNRAQAALTEYEQIFREARTSWDAADFMLKYGSLLIASLITATFIRVIYEMSREDNY